MQHAVSLTETTILSQAPGPKLWLMSTLRGSGGVHSVRLYWMFIRPTSMGAICKMTASSVCNGAQSPVSTMEEACSSMMNGERPQRILNSPRALRCSRLAGRDAGLTLFRQGTRMKPFAGDGGAE